MIAAEPSDSIQNADRGGVPVRAVTRRTASPEGVVPPAWSSVPAGPQPLTAQQCARRRSGWTDQLIGVSVAAALHLYLLFGMNDRPSGEPAANHAPEEMYVRLEMPPIEPPEPVEVVEMSDTEPVPVSAPPMMMDLPTTVPVSTFVQLIQPVIDPSLTAVGAITIPSYVATAGTAQAVVRLFDFRELDRVPRRLRTTMPVYPHELRRAGITGEVVLMVIIDASGHVEVERVLSATHRDFEVAAVKAAEQCVFESPLKGGQRVSARYTWHIPFDLK